MGGGGDTPSDTTSTTTVELPKWIQPYSTELLRRGSALSRDSSYKRYGGRRVAEYGPGIQRQFNELYGRVNADTETSNAELRKIIGGAYLDPESNPWLKATYGKAAGDVTDAYRTGTAAQTNAATAFNNSFGGSAHQERQSMNERDLGRTLSGLGTDIYGGNYQQERQRQLSATQALPQNYAMMGQFQDRSSAMQDALRGVRQQKLDKRYEEWLRKQEWPLRQLDILGSVIGQSMGRSGQSTTTQNNPQTSQYNQLLSLLGAGIGGYGAYREFNR